MARRMNTAEFPVGADPVLRCQPFLRDSSLAGRTLLHPNLKQLEADHNPLSVGAGFVEGSICPIKCIAFLRFTRD